MAAQAEVFFTSSFVAVDDSVRALVSSVRSTRRTDLLGWNPSVLERWSSSLALGGPGEVLAPPRHCHEPVPVPRGHRRARPRNVHFGLAPFVLGLVQSNERKESRCHSSRTQQRWPRRGRTWRRGAGATTTPRVSHSQTTSG